MALPKIKFAGGGERAQYLTHKGNDTTIRFVVDYPGLVDPDALCQAAKAVVESVDILHSTFFIDGTSAYWMVNQEVDQTHYFRYIHTDGDPAVTARSLSVFPVYHEGKAQLHCTLVQSAAASSIVVCISHLCVDGGDGKYLLGKLVEAYNRILTSGSAEGLVVKDGSRAPEQVYETLDLKDAKGLLKTPLSGASSAYPYPTEAPGRCRMVFTQIPREIMDAARKRAKAGGATANDLLLAACYQAYGELPEIDASAPVSISSMMDLRRHCKGGESEGLCNMSGAMPTALENGVPTSFAECLECITRQTTAAKDDPTAGLGGLPILHLASRGLPMWVLLMVMGKAYGHMPVGLTNLGNLRCQALALGPLIPTGGVFGGPLKRKPGMQVSIISFDGTCTLAVYGQYTDEDAAHLTRFLEAMAEKLEAYAAEAL